MASENTISDLQHLNGLLFSLEKNLKKNTVYLHFGPLFFCFCFIPRVTFQTQVISCICAQILKPLNVVRAHQ